MAPHTCVSIQINVDKEETLWSGPSMSTPNPWIKCKYIHALNFTYGSLCIKLLISHSHTLSLSLKIKRNILQVLRIWIGVVFFVSLAFSSSLLFYLKLQEFTLKDDASPPNLYLAKKEGLSLLNLPCRSPVPMKSYRRNGRLRRDQIPCTTSDEKKSDN